MSPATPLLPIKLAHDLELPLDAVTQKCAFLGRSGTGKTFAAGRFVEQLLDAGAQVVIVDVVGTWWGLRLAADGKAAGFSIPVFGGDHADEGLELGPAAGVAVADLLVDRGIPAVLDVSGFTQGELKRFAADFAERLFHRKKQARSPMHLVLEEAQTLIPQRVESETRGGNGARCLGAFERIGKVGRNYGIGLTLISQRPQAVHKDVLSQTEALFVFQTNGAHERKALEQWIVEQSGDRMIVRELPGLARGTAYVWSPQWLRLFRKVKIAPKRTYDASATPTFNMQAPIEPQPLKPADLRALQAAMIETTKHAPSTEPRALQRRIAELEGKLRAAAAPVAPVVPIVERQVVQVVPPALERLLGTARVSADEFLSLGVTLAIARSAIECASSSVEKDLGEALERLRAADRTAQALAARFKSAIEEAGSLLKPATSADEELATRSRGLVVAEGAPAPKLVGERNVLAAIAHGGDLGVTRAQITALTGYKKSTRDLYLRKLGDKIERRATSGRFVARPAGLAELGPDHRPMPLSEALRAGLDAGEVNLLTAIAQAGEAGVSGHELSALTGYKKSTRDLYLRKLASKELVRKEGDRHVAEAFGIAALGADFRRLPTGAALLQHWLERLPEGEARMLRELAKAFPDGIDREKLSEALGYKKSTRDLYVRNLTTKRLATVKGKEVIAAVVFFGRDAS